MEAGAAWTLSDTKLIFPPQFGYEGLNNGIGYSATVPFADVGHNSFTVPVDGQVTANPCDTGSYSPGEVHQSCTGTLTVTGTYTFTKLCDGTITYAGGAESGQCTATVKVFKTGTGKGSVTSSPAGISCGSVCSHSFATGTGVTLSAHPAAGARFAGWSGACTGTGTCKLRMNANKSVTARFRRARHRTATSSR